MTAVGPGGPTGPVEETPDKATPEKASLPRRWFRRFADSPWWVHVLATLGVVLAIVVGAAGVSAVLFLDFVHERGPLAADVPPQTQITGAEGAQIAAGVAPVLRYDSKELFVPISRAAYVSRTQLKEQSGRFVRLLKAIVGEDNLPESLGNCLTGCFLYLDVRGVEPDPPKHSERAYAAIGDKLLRSGAQPTVYYHVSRYDDTGDYAVQFWFLYLFNYRLNEHESDWEQITVRLDENRQPVDAFYSAHEGGNANIWARIQTVDGHPVDYPARGSHANYFVPGRHRVQIVCKRVIGSFKECLKGRAVVVDVSDAAGKELGPGDYDLRELTGPIFAGSFGSGNYVVLTRKPDVLRDPRARQAWADPLSPLR